MVMSRFPRYLSVKEFEVPEFSTSNIPSSSTQSQESQDNTQRRRGESGDCLQEALKNGSIHFL